MDKNLLISSLFIIVPWLITLVINGLLLKFSQTLGIRNKNDVTIRWSNTSKPSLGGISMYVSFLICVFLYLVINVQTNIFNDIHLIGLFIASGLAFIMGLADDAYNTKPLLKFSIQIVCGLIIAMSGSVINLSSHYWLNAFLTVFWVIILMNSLNMLDNMDGITTTVVIFILLSCLCCNLVFNLDSLSYWNYILIGLISSLIGFLRYNAPSAKIFMGDSGSQFLGLIAAFFSIKFLWNFDMSFQVPVWNKFYVVLICFTAPAIDSLSVVINRLKKRQSPMVGGKDHTTHHLVYAGYSERQVWYVFLSISFLASVLGIFMMYLVRNEMRYQSLLLTPFFFIAFYFLYRNTQKYKQPDK